MNLTTFDILQREKWIDYLNRIERKDIYFTPEYCQLYEKNGEGKAQLLIYEEGDRFIYYSFLLRKISDITNLMEKEKKHGEMYDIITPYGYGGPISNEKDPILKKNLFHNFNKSLKKYCEQNNIITEFIRYHPILRNDLDNIDVEPEYVRNTIFVDLTLDMNEIWAKYDTKNRNRIRKSILCGLRVVQRSINEKENFINLYYKTMDKKNAFDYYYFKPIFFENMVNLLDDHIKLFEVLFEEKVIMSCFFMNYGDYFHYHLLGSDKDYLKYAPNNLLINHVVELAKSQGFKFMHLGGGYSGEDSLYKFKKHFNKNGDLKFFIGKKIHNQEIYHDLIKDFNHTGNECNDFFPLYRHPLLIEQN